MSVTRKALLITSPGQPASENYLKGVYIDLGAFKRLLKSSVGGAWEDSEIAQIDSPSRQMVRDSISALSDFDYTFVVFTGHGWYSSVDKDRILELGGGQQIASNELLAGTNKRTLVLDSCQKIYTQSLQEKVAHVLNASRAAELRIPSRAACRAAFSKGIQDAGPGYLKLMSCRIDEYSYADDAEGSRYSMSLIDAASSWAYSQAQKHTYGSSMLSAVGAHNIAAVETAKHTVGKQNPTIEKPGTMPYFPFAVFS